MYRQQNDIYALSRQITRLLNIFDLSLEWQGSNSRRSSFVDLVEDKVRNRFLFALIVFMFYILGVFVFIQREFDTPSIVTEIVPLITLSGDYQIGRSVCAYSPCPRIQILSQGSPLEGVNASIVLKDFRQANTVNQPDCGDILHKEATLERINLDKVCRVVLANLDGKSDLAGKVVFSSFTLFKGPQGIYSFAFSAGNITSDIFQANFESEVQEIQILNEEFPSFVRVGSPFTIQPVVRLLDKNSEPVQGKQVSAFTWHDSYFEVGAVQEHAYLSRNKFALLAGDESGKSDAEGVARFTDLQLLTSSEDSFYLYLTCDNAVVRLWHPPISRTKLELDVPQVFRPLMLSRKNSPFILRGEQDISELGGTSSEFEFFELEMVGEYDRSVSEGSQFATPITVRITRVHAEEGVVQREPGAGAIPVVFIAGKNGDDLPYGYNVNDFEAGKQLLYPIEGVYDEDNTLESCTEADSEGKVTFSLLRFSSFGNAGTFKLRVQYLGYYVESEYIEVVSRVHSIAILENGLVQVQDAEHKPLEGKVPTLKSPSSDIYLNLTTFAQTFTNKEGIVQLQLVSPAGSAQYQVSVDGVDSALQTYASDAQSPYKCSRVDLLEYPSSVELGIPFRLRAQVWAESGHPLEGVPVLVYFHKPDESVPRSVYPTLEQGSSKGTVMSKTDADGIATFEEVRVSEAASGRFVLRVEAVSQVVEYHSNYVDSAEQLNSLVDSPYQDMNQVLIREMNNIQQLPSTLEVNGQVLDIANELGLQLNAEYHRCYFRSEAYLFRYSGLSIRLSNPVQQLHLYFGSPDRTDAYLQQAAAAQEAIESFTHYHDQDTAPHQRYLNFLQFHLQPHASYDLTLALLPPTPSPHLSFRFLRFPDALLPSYLLDSAVLDTQIQLAQSPSSSISTLPLTLNTLTSLVPGGTYAIVAQSRGVSSNVLWVRFSTEEVRMSVAEHSNLCSPVYTRYPQVKEDRPVMNTHWHMRQEATDECVYCEEEMEECRSDQECRAKLGECNANDVCVLYLIDHPKLTNYQRCRTGLCRRVVARKQYLKHEKQLAQIEDQCQQQLSDCKEEECHKDACFNDCLSWTKCQECMQKAYYLRKLADCVQSAIFVDYDYEEPEWDYADCEFYKLGDPIPSIQVVSSMRGILINAYVLDTPLDSAAHATSIDIEDYFGVWRQSAEGLFDKLTLVDSEERQCVRFGFRVGDNPGIRELAWEISSDQITGVYCFENHQTIALNEDYSKVITKYQPFKKAIRAYLNTGLQIVNLLAFYNDTQVRRLHSNRCVYIYGISGKSCDVYILWNNSTRYLFEVSFKNMKWIKQYGTQVQLTVSTPNTKQLNRNKVNAILREYLQNQDEDQLRESLTSYLQTHQQSTSSDLNPIIDQIQLSKQANQSLEVYKAQQRFIASFQSTLLQTTLNANTGQILIQNYPKIISFVDAPDLLFKVKSRIIVKVLALSSESTPISNSLIYLQLVPSYYFVNQLNSIGIQELLANLNDGQTQLIYVASILRSNANLELLGNTATTDSTGYAYFRFLVLTGIPGFYRCQFQSGLSKSEPAEIFYVHNSIKAVSFQQEYNLTLQGEVGPMVPLYQEIKLFVDYNDQVELHRKTISITLMEYIDYNDLSDESKQFLNNATQSIKQIYSTSQYSQLTSAETITEFSSLLLHGASLYVTVNKADQNLECSTSTYETDQLQQCTFKYTETKVELYIFLFDHQINKTRSEIILSNFQLTFKKYDTFQIIVSVDGIETIPPQNQIVFVSIIKDSTYYVRTTVQLNFY